MGWPYCRSAWEAAGFPPSHLIPVPEQKDPHPDFPTGSTVRIFSTKIRQIFSPQVEYPNPEEGASSLDLAFRTADTSGARYRTRIIQIIFVSIYHFNYKSKGPVFFDNS